MPSTRRPVSPRPSGRVGTGSPRARTPARGSAVAPVGPGAAAPGQDAGPESPDRPTPSAAARPDGQRARTPLTGRAAILAVVVLVLALSFAYPFRGWFDQRAQISELHERTIAQRQHIAELEATLERWDDPAYVETVARDRLRFVMPGEASFVVLGGGEPAAEAALAAPAAGGDWWEQLWATVAEADDPALVADGSTGGSPAPAATAPSSAPSTGSSTAPTGSPSVPVP